MYTLALVDARGRRAVSGSHTVRVVIDGHGSDAMACARLLASDGHAVVHAGRDETHVVGDLLVVDCWTAESAPLICAHRRAGASVTGIGDLVLERTRARTLGVTGSGGKTTVTRLAAAMMAAGGCAVAVSHSARAANAWPAAETLDGLPGPAADSWLALELTSTHLAYMSRSPELAVITAFWPDHLELHGSIERYREAKLNILRHQRPADAAIINVDDPGAAGLAPSVRAALFEASAARSIVRGVGVEAGQVVSRVDDPVTLCPVAALPFPPPLDALAVTAACAALVAGATPDGVARVLVAPPPLPHRRRVIGTIDGVRVIDDSAATTPRKAIGALAGLDPARTVVIAGGTTTIDGAAVLADRAEAKELADALDVLRRVRSLVGFGPAAERLDAPITAPDLTAALTLALERARSGDTILLAPMFPVDPNERETFARLAAGRSA